METCVVIFVFSFRQNKDQTIQKDLERVYRGCCSCLFICQLNERTFGERPAGQLKVRCYDVRPTRDTIFDIKNHVLKQFKGRTLREYNVLLLLSCSRLFICQLNERTFGQRPEGRQSTKLRSKTYERHLISKQKQRTESDTWLSHFENISLTGHLVPIEYRRLFVEIEVNQRIRRIRSKWNNKQRGRVGKLILVLGSIS